MCSLFSKRVSFRLQMSLIWLGWLDDGSSPLLVYYSFILMENKTGSSTNGQPVALVTGANQGVGNEIAKALAANGYIVYVSSRKSENGEKAAAEIGENAKAIQLDVTQQSTIDAAVERIEKNTADLTCWSITQVLRMLVSRAARLKKLWHLAGQQMCH